MRVAACEPPLAVALLPLLLAPTERRLQADQLDELARICRTLNRRRGGEGERITENTLIRVAVDMLLARVPGSCGGSTEVELRKSVTS